MSDRRLGFPVPRALGLAALALMGATACAAPGADDAPFDLTAAREVFDANGSSMGTVAFRVSCSEEASAHVRLGLALLHNMTYAEAEGAFAEAAERDESCGMAYWGMAMTYVHPLWPDVPSDEQLDRGWQLLQQARAAGLPTDREERYVRALEAYYRDAASRGERERLADYQREWAAVQEAYPADTEAALFNALAMIAAAQGSPSALEKQRAAGAIAEQVLAHIADHPGAHHYVIHAYDSPDLSGQALPVAHSYGAVAPENSHALHMTSHIFTREGLWDASIDYNQRAADVALGEPIAGRVSHHYLHAVDYLAYAHLQRGADDRALGVLEQVRSLEGPVVDNAASAYAFAAVPARVAVERKRWEDAARVTVREPSTIAWEKYPHLEAIPVFARALGSARSGDLAGARREVERLGELAGATAAVPDAYDWQTQVRVQEIAARAWIEFAEGRTEDALDSMREAAGLEAGTQKNPVTPGEVLPAGELLGDMLLELELYPEAVVAYELALERNRNRFNSLLGAAMAAEGAGDRAKARAHYSRLLEVTDPDTGRRDAIERARRYIGSGG